MDDSEPLLTPREREFLASNPHVAIADPPADPSVKPARVGVGGWLGFLAISLVVLGPLVTVAMTAAEISNLKSLNPDAAATPQWSNAVAVSWATVIAYSAISIFAGYRLFKHHVWRTVPIVIACMWIAGPGVGILSLMAMDDMSGGNVTAGDVGAGLGKSIVSCFGWTLYLLLSRRVKNTYKSSDREPLGKRWMSLDRSRRQYVFFALCWIILSFLYYTFVAPPDPYSDDAGPNMWAVILLPPVLLGIGTWAYNKFVGGA